jgi:hypothetical protein
MGPLGAVESPLSELRRALDFKLTHYPSATDIAFGELFETMKDLRAEQ